jgi:hypothetical protein
MERAAGTIDYALRQHQEFLSGWLQELRDVLTEMTKPTYVIDQAPPRRGG